MTYIHRILWLVGAIIIATACVKEPKMTVEEVEKRSLAAWIEKYHPELKDNLQEEGGYYVEVLDYGVQDSAAVTGKDVWVWYDFTNRDFQGNVCETRSWHTAYQLGTYTDHTHYNPVFRFSGKESHTLMEGTYLATFNTLKVRNEASGAMEDVEVRYGTRLRLYMPSTITKNTAGATSDGGYEGQYELDDSKPLIVEMTIYGHVENPVAYEGERVDLFAENNGGVCTDHKVAKEETQEKAQRRHITRTEGESDEEEEVDTRPLEFFDGRWHQPIDTLEHLYVNYAYSPEDVAFNFQNTPDALYPNEGRYNAGTIYSTTSGVSQLDDVDSRINKALVERFGRGITHDEVLDADSLKVEATAKVWYIGRFLDGYIFDTNIDEVKEIIYGKVESAGTALDFDTRKPLENSYILAWNYSLPTLRYGQWATILTVSTYAYGLQGQVGSHTSTTTSNNDAAYYDTMNYYNYMNYMNSYYGYGYGSMYNNGYYGYNPYYYGYDYSANTNSSTTTVITTSTEIQSYTPLIFQVFVEKNKKK
ncbi:MAG: hypothetical protein IKC12_04675 [Alistipes sp.]|nr:hypothetical protein [Alistipes sp.]